MKSKQLMSITLCLIVSLMSCLTLVSCFNAGPPDGYLGTDTTSVFFIQFTNKNNQLNGSIQGIEETNDMPPQTKSLTEAFAGTQNGISVTLTVSIFGFSSSVVGTLNGNTLVLDVPQSDGHLQSETFTGASTQQYNQAVDALRSKVSQEDQQYNNTQATATSAQATQTEQQNEQQATQTAQQGEQQAVSDANTQLGNALSALKSNEAGLASFSETSTLNSYAKDWQTMQKDFTTEQQDANAGCGDGNYNYGTVQYDAGTVDYDEGTIQYDDGTLNYDKNTYNSELSPVQNDVQAVKTDWAQLQQAVANNTTHTPEAAYASNDVNNALQNAQGVEKTAQGVWQSAQSSAAQYDNEASALKQKADALPASMHCS